MPIDVREPQSPGWWLQRLSRDLDAEKPRLEEMRQRYEGNAPLPAGPDGEARRVYEPYWKKARTNFAELVVEAVRERLKVTGFRTAAAGDENGDVVARQQWDDTGGDIVQADVHEFVLSMGRGYTITGLDPDTKKPVTTAEDPRQVITVHDPVFERKVRAALKMFHDDELDRDNAYLYLPGRVRVAYLDRKARNLTGPRFSPARWAWDQERGGEDGEPFIGADGVEHPAVVPVVRFRNRLGVAEFERHVDILDRLDHQTLQRMVIATMQAFRQRAVKNATLKDKDGNLIDYNELLAADPGSVWLLPGAVEMWESGQVDLSGILSAEDKDIGKLAAVTRTPLPMLMPGDGAESAEGASFKKEGLVFKAEDLIVRLTEGWKDTKSLMFLFAGDAERADRSQLEVLWAPPERRSLAERADAASKAQDLPWPTRMVKVWGFTPTDVARMESERAQDQLAAAVLAPAALAPATSAPAAGVDPATVKAQADAFGVFVRQGVSPESAAAKVGLSGLVFTGAVPSSLRLPESDAEDLE